MTKPSESRPPEAPPPEPPQTGEPDKGGPGNGGRTPPPGLFTWALLIALALAPMMFLIARGGPEPPAATVSYTEFKQRVANNEVDQVTFQGDRLVARLTTPAPGPAGQTTQHIQSRLPPLPDPELLQTLERAGVEVESLPPAEQGAGSWVAALLPWLLIIGFWWFIWRRMASGLGGGGGLGPAGLGDFMKGRAKQALQSGPPKTRFQDVAGQDSAKAEVAELLEFLRRPERYQRLGAEAPKGILLEGPPGTGKTLLARALAGEAGVPFFHISASEFIEVFVGVGASRVRAMFKEAKKNAPSIIFIDELDSIGRVRGTGIGGGHDEREQTLNQILAEMDGFEGHEAVVVLAATNRPDVLDPALLRPGRFDRHITLELPDLKARLAILTVHCRKTPLAPSVDLERIAAATPGFSGADLKNLVNEAAMAAAREDATEVDQRHFDMMRERIVLGAERALAIAPDEKHRLAVHEAGHATVAYFLPEADPIDKVTVIPRGRSLGATHLLPEIERHTLPQSYLETRLAVMLGGRAAEKLFLESLSSGADDDIKGATEIARAMVGRWGMSDEIGPVDVRESESHPFLGREMAQPRRFSEKTAANADAAVHRTLHAAERTALDILTARRARAAKLIEALEASETLDREAIAKLLGPKTAGAPPGPRATAPLEGEETPESGSRRRDDL
ncbi:MAG: ATP-dependent zinc metalloprotease FtsH [Alphaproteobacteria bacterium]|nr:ATP-dependent zinc metalloprotease FtsH [Alphaproteobacteria bacterium]